jgi:catechol 2,3-dioxygenase-like lactoylglutathione lyase family enzyme
LIRPLYRRSPEESSALPAPPPWRISSCLPHITLDGTTHTVPDRFRYTGFVTIKRANTILYCARWAETVHFYEQHLALPVLVRKDWFVEFGLGPDSALSVADELRASISSSHGEGLTISLRVDDVGAAREELVAAGLDPGPMRPVWGSRAFFLWDPEGNRLELWS